jgi:hypothetical protein
MTRAAAGDGARRFPVGFDSWYRNVIGLPVRLRELLVSVEEPSMLAAALGRPT